MIDVENYIVDHITSALHETFPEVRALSSRMRTPSEFPCVMLYESGNKTLESTRWIDGVERHAEIRFTAEVYTNDRSGRKEKAKNILAAIDTEMQKLGFFRASHNYSFTYAESTICGITAAYRGIVGEGAEADLDTLYVYRR